ncbi:DUF4349 domain-containing protein [Kitasatospora sp. NPDC091207]|uniref:DUF4349 domain-containing protein n=1 Tax=Kitasatospora sp. NPDC091207 TaxID=3364083 RepID=UPI00381C1185
MERGRHRAGVLAAVVVSAVLAGGCGASDRGDSARGAAAAGDAAAPAAPGVAAPGVAAPAAPKAAPESGTGQTSTGQSDVVPVVDTRQIAYSAQLSVRVARTDTALARARELAVGAGGYVASETVSGGGQPGDTGTGRRPEDRPAPGPQSGQLTVKVPSAAYQQTLDQLAGLGEVLSRKSQADDLTQQVADVSSRTQTQQASVDRVRALMAQAKTLAEITSLEGELSRREADLESLQKQLKELSAKTSLSTITLDVRQRADTPVPDRPDAKEHDGFWDSVGSALGGGWDVLTAIVRGIAVAVAAVTPFLLVLVPAALAFWLVRRRRRPALPPVPAHPPHQRQGENEDEPARERQEP